MNKCQPSQCRVEENSRQGEQHMQSHRILCGNKCARESTSRWELQVQGREMRSRAEDRSGSESQTDHKQI